MRHGLSLAGLVLFLGLALGSDGGNQSGTVMGPQMDAYAVQYLADHNILQPGEQVLVYFDYTISLDGSESALVTDRRVIYDKAGNTTSIDLIDIASVETSESPLMGHVINVIPTSGPALQVEVAALNGGELFISELERAKAAATAQ